MCLRVPAIGAAAQPQKKPSIAQLQCSGCGATTNAACNCGAPYVPAGTRAAEAIAKNPEKSSRKIAEEIGVSEPTVRRARKSTASCDAVEKRVGRDGKSRKLPERQSVDTVTPADVQLVATVRKELEGKGEIPRTQHSDPVDTAADPIQQWQRSLGNLAGNAISMRAFWKRQFGDWEKFEVTSELVTLVRQAADMWTALAQQLERDAPGP
jgi:DNA-binding MarR family transcriptional regulator